MQTMDLVSLKTRVLPLYSISLCDLYGEILISFPHSRPGGRVLGIVETESHTGTETCMSILVPNKHKGEGKMRYM